MTASTGDPAILLVGPGLRGGGAEGQFALMARHFFAGRLPVALLTGKPEDVVDGGRFHFLAWRSQWSYLRIIPYFYWLVLRNNYQVIFAFGLFPCLVAACATLGRKGRVRLIVSEITRPRRADEGAGFIRRRLYRCLRRFAYRRAAVLTANSIDGVQEMCDIAGVDASKGRRRVANIVEWERLQEAASQPGAYRSPGARYFICASRLVPMKRIDTVLAAMALLPLEENIHLVIVGDGPAHDELNALAVRLGLPARTHFAGWLNNPLPLVKNAAALILASEYEGFSNSVLEAMFLDTPVITSLCSADAEEMCEQGAALGFSVGDERALAICMRRLLTEPETAVRLIDNARRYRQPLAMENSLPDYEKIILAVYEQARA